MLQHSRIFAFIFCLSLASLLRGNVFAQTHTNSLLQQAGLNYHRQHILPVINKQRQKLEEQLSEEDKKTLQSYRLKMRSIYMRSQRLQAAPASVPGQPEADLTQQQQRASLRAEDEAVRQQVTALAQKYAPVLAQIAAEVAPLKKQWAADLAAIKKKYASPTATTPERTLEMSQVEYWFSPVSFLMSEP